MPDCKEGSAWVWLSLGELASEKASAQPPRALVLLFDAEGILKVIKPLALEPKP